MSIKFKAYYTPKPNGRKGMRLTHARAISRGTYNLEKVAISSWMIWGISRHH